MTDKTLMTNGRIVDGTGAQWFHGSVLLSDGRIDRIGREDILTSDAENVIDVEHNVICPGFIDTHSHSAIELFENPMLEPKIRQGVTTEIVGQDGFSVAPVVGDEKQERWARQLKALDGRADGLSAWESVADYYDAVEENGIAPNIGTLVGHGTVRFGELGMSDETPGPEALERMADLVEQALDDGALGVSTGLVYPPAVHADTEEVHAIAAPLARHGRPFVAHIRSERRSLWDALTEFIEVGAQEGVPLHLSHFKMCGPELHGHASRAFALIKAARARGVDMTIDQYPYTASSTVLSYLLPPWATANDSTVELLADEQSREEMRKDIYEWRLDDWDNPGPHSGWDEIVITDTTSGENAGCEGQSIAQIASERCVDPATAVFDLLVEEEMNVNIRIHSMSDPDVREILSNERVNVGSDGIYGSRPHPRLYGTFPRVLGQYVREENLLTLEAAVRKMTSLPARAMGLDRKGVIRPGMDADVVVFDPESVASRATYEQPKQFPTGITHVFVNGEAVVSNGEVTHATPGAPIRDGRKSTVACSTRED